MSAYSHKRTLAVHQTISHSTPRRIARPSSIPGLVHFACRVRLGPPPPGLGRLCCARVRSLTRQGESMDVAEWLRGLGLESHAEAFAENAIDAEALVLLSDEDLKELGVSALGHRRKLLAAIAE